MSDQVRVLAFGAFDPLHAGHVFFLQQAKSLGDHLLVVVARNSSIRHNKKREVYQPEEERLRAVTDIPCVDEVILGHETAHRYEILKELDFDVLVLGYDQTPTDKEVRKALNDKGKFQTKVVRLPAWQPHTHKSSFIREAGKE